LGFETPKGREAKIPIAGSSVLDYVGFRIHCNEPAPRWWRITVGMRIVGEEIAHQNIKSIREKKVPGVRYGK
jgi:hypothetical protein